MTSVGAALTRFACEPTSPASGRGELDELFGFLCRRDRGLTAGTRAADRGGSYGATESGLQRNAPIQRGGEHAGEAIAGACGIDRGYAARGNVEGGGVIGGLGALISERAHHGCAECAVQVVRGCATTESGQRARPLQSRLQRECQSCAVRPVRVARRGRGSARFARRGRGHDGSVWRFRWPALPSAAEAWCPVRAAHPRFAWREQRGWRPTRRRSRYGRADRRRCRRILSCHQFR